MKAELYFDSDFKFLRLYSLQALVKYVGPFLDIHSMNCGRELDKNFSTDSYKMAGIDSII